MRKALFLREWLCVLFEIAATVVWVGFALGSFGVGGNRNIGFHYQIQYDLFGSRDLVSVTSAVCIWLLRYLRHFKHVLWRAFLWVKAVFIYGSGGYHRNTRLLARAANTRATHVSFPHALPSCAIPKSISFRLGALLCSWGNINWSAIITAEW